MKLPALLTKTKAAKLTRRLKPPPAIQAPPRPVKPLPAIPLPGDLKKRLIALRHRYQMVHSTTGIFMLLGALSGLFLAQGVSDWYFDLPWMARAMFLAIDIVLLITIYRRHLHAPLKKKLGLRETALMVEKKWPKLAQSVITAVEMSEGNAKATRGSLELVEIVLQQARARTTNLNFKEVVPTRMLKRSVTWGCVLTLGTLAIAAVTFPASLSLLERIFLLNVPLPTKTIVVPISGDLTVPLGTDVEISAQAKGVIPTHGRVTIAYDEGNPEEFPLTVLPDKPATFSYTVHNVQRPFKYRFYLNDGHGPEFTVMAKVPPTVTNVECTEVYPSYTGLPEQKIPTTALTLLAGSHLKIKATATEPLKSATVVLQGIAQPVEMTLDSAKTGLEGDVLVPAKDMTGFSLHVVDTDGLASTNETVYPVDLVPDKPPLVKITEPVQDSETITLRAKPVIAFDASDDYGITHLVLCYQTVPPLVAGEDKNPPSDVQQVPIKIKTAKEGTHYEYVLDVSAQNPPWKEGWTVNYWIEATDNNTATGPGVTKTDHKEFGILSPADKEAEILNRIKQNASDIDTLSDTQQKVSHDVDESIPKK
jgi:hypothetical protein